MGASEVKKISDNPVTSRATSLGDSSRRPIIESPAPITRTAANVSGCLT